MFKKTFVICLLVGASFAKEQANQDQSSSETNVKREAPPSSSYGPPEKEPGPVYGPPSSESSGSSGGWSSESSGSTGGWGSPQSYSKSIPAAAIRNVETVAVTKTITPVVTKTTTYNTHSEPALSIGHVQGYSHSAKGQPKIAPVQFQTQYTTYLNPTVGVNGPVTYTGPAMVFGSGGGAFAIPLSLSTGGGSGGAVYGAPAQSSGAPSGSYGPPGQSAGSPLGSYSMNIPQIFAIPQNYRQVQIAPVAQKQTAAAATQAVSASTPAQVMQAPGLNQQHHYGNHVAFAAPNAIRASPSTASASIAAHPYLSNPYYAAALYQQQMQLQQQRLLASASARQPVYLQQPLHHQQQYRIHRLPQQYQQQIQAQPSQPIQFIQTYAAPSFSVTRFQPVSSLQKHQLGQQQITKPI